MITMSWNSRSVLHSLLCTGLAALALCVPAKATTTRIAGLAGGADYLSDESNSRRWYASLAGQPDLLVVEPGTLDLDAGGLAWSQRVWQKGGGLFLRADPSGRHGTFAAFFVAHPDDGVPGGGIAAQYGRAWGRFGAGLSISGSSSMESSGAEGQYVTGRSDYVHVLGTGLSWATGERSGVEIAGEIVNTQFSMTDLSLGIDFTGGNSWRGFGFRARGHLGAGESVVVTPILDFWRDDRMTYVDVLPALAHRDAWQRRAGVGAVGTLSPTRLLVASAEYRDGKEDYTGASRVSRFSISERTYWAVDWRIGLETRALSWLQVRVGAEYRRVNESYVRSRSFAWDPYIDLEAATNVRVETPLTLGCTATAGDLFLDLVLSDGTPSSATFLRAENGFADNAHLLAATIGWKF